MNKFNNFIELVLSNAVYIIVFTYIISAFIVYFLDLHIYPDERLLIIFLILILVVFTSKNRRFIRVISLLLLVVSILGVRNYFEFYLSEQEFSANYEKYISSEAIVIYDSQIASKSKTVVQLNGYEGYVLIETGRFSKFYTGDKVKISGALEQPESFEEFDYKSYLNNKKIFGVIKSENVELIENASGYWGVIDSIKKYVVGKFEEYFTQPNASMLSGMIIGDISGITRSFEEDLQITGTTHVVAVSGYNISIILSTILMFSGAVGKRRLLTVSLIFLIIFICIVGFNNLSAVRAFIFGSAFIISRLSGRRGSNIFILALAVFFILLINPRNFIDIGFQLSFASTIGIMYFSDKVENSLERIIKNEFLKSELSVVLTAFLSVTPIVLVNFENLNIGSIIVNLIIGPIIPFITFGGILFLTLSLFGSTILSLVSYIINTPVDTFVKLINQFSNARLLYFENINIDQNLFLIFYLVEIVIINALYKKLRKKY